MAKQFFNDINNFDFVSLSNLFSNDTKEFLFDSHERKEKNNIIHYMHRKI